MKLLVASPESWPVPTKGRVLQLVLFLLLDPVILDSMTKYIVLYYICINIMDPVAAFDSGLSTLVWPVL